MQNWQVALLTAAAVLVVLAVAVFFFLRHFNVKSNFKPVKEGYVVVTGASTGIGADAAISLAQKGFKVFAGVRKEAAVESLQKQLRERGGDVSNLMPLVIDVCKQDTIDAAAQFVSNAVKDQGIVGLVNNAGVHTEGPIEFQPLDSFRYQFDVNFFGQVATTQAFMPLLRRAQGRVINVTSVAGFISAPFEGAYSASKRALEAVSDSLRRELSPWKMSVSVIEPGFIQTDLVSKAVDHRASILDELPKGARTYYGGYYERPNRGIPPKLVGTADLTSRAIVHALTSSQPKTRYVVGTPAFLKMVDYAQLVPDRYADKVTAKKTWPKDVKVCPAFVPNA